MNYSVRHINERYKPIRMEAVNETDKNGKQQSQNWLCRNFYFQKFYFFI